MRHAMIDLETLDTRPEGVILSIGVALFDPYDPKTEPVAGYYGVLSKADQLSRGRTTSASTLAWWEQQSPEARTVLSDVQKPVVGVLKDLRSSINWNEIDGVWGNGASFDNAMLKSIFADWDMDLPWAFWKDRCYRTMKSVYENTKGHKLDIPRQGTYHNALDDAMHQARGLQIILNHLGDINV